MASWKEALRRIYHEMVVGRSRVRIAAAEDAPLSKTLDQRPIFLLGTYGSGTTLLRYVVDSHSRIACPPESDFIEGLATLLTEERYLQGLAAMGFDQDHVAQRLRQDVLYFFANYARSWNKPRWADKTPAYVEQADVLRRLFPEAQFVILHRHGLDQAHSYTRGGTFDRQPLEAYRQGSEDLRLSCCRFWLDQTRRLLDFEASFPDDCHRLRYEDLCRQPEASLRPLFEFLGESWEPSVLDFHQRPHDKGHEHGRVVATQGFELSAGHFETWPEDLRREGFEMVASGLEALGYEVPEE